MRGDRGTGQGLLLEAEVLINEEFTGTFAIVRANYTQAAPTVVRASFNPREGESLLCKSSRAVPPPRDPIIATDHRSNNLFSLIKKPRLPRIA